MYQELISKSEEKKLQTASNRDVYQELEAKQEALSSLRKEQEDCRQREHLGKRNFEALCRCIPRLLMKLNKMHTEDVTIDKV